MATLRTFLVLVLGSLLFVACSKPKEAGPSELFAAMIMTKQQRASSVPTDFGVLVRDADSGEWRRLGPAIQMISSVTVDPSDPATLFLAAGNGISRSSDGGKTWKLVTGWRESDVMQIAIDPGNSDRIYAASAWGVTVSRDGGETWKEANQGLEEFYSKGIVLDQQDPSRLLLANGHGIYESTDLAAHWSRLGDLPKIAVMRLRQSTSNPDRWLAGTEKGGLWISQDNARTWTQTAPTLADKNIYGVALAPQEADLLAAGGWGTGVVLSRDGGRTWNTASGRLASPNITSLAFDPNNAGRLWASTFEEGTFFTDDFGETWQSANLDGAYVFDLGFLPALEQ